MLSLAIVAGLVLMSPNSSSRAAERAGPDQARRARRLADRGLRPARRGGLSGAGCRRRCGRKGIKVDILNAGVSGDTTSAGRDRLDWSIPDGTEAVIVELGANDALRGLDPKVAKAALEDIIKRLQGAQDRGDARGHVRAAQLRAGLRGEVRSDLSRSRARPTTCRSIRSFSTALPARQGSISRTAFIRRPKASTSSSRASSRRSRRS